MGSRFNSAAATYEQVTSVQRIVSTIFASKLAATGIPAKARVAEFGCGTGYLAEALIPRLAPSLWVATDIALAMTAQVHCRMPSSNVVTAVMDASRPALLGPFDLVCSSFALHWLPRPSRVLPMWRRLLRPGGRVAVTCPIEGTFAEWRNALSRVGVTCASPVFPSLDLIRTWFAPATKIDVLEVSEVHSDGLAFARACSAAGVNCSAHPALDAATVRKALREFELTGSQVSYRVAMIVE